MLQEERFRNGNLANLHKYHRKSSCSATSHLVAPRQLSLRHSLTCQRSFLLRTNSYTFLSYVVLSSHTYLSIFLYFVLYSFSFPRSFVLDLKEYKVKLKIWANVPWHPCKGRVHLHFLVKDLVRVNNHSH